MFSLIIFIVLLISIVCLLKHRGLILTLLTIALVPLVVASLVLTILAAISAIFFAMFGGPMFDTFLIWLMSAGTWGLSACMLAFINRYCDDRTEFKPMETVGNIGGNRIDQYINKRLDK